MKNLSAQDAGRLNAKSSQTEEKIQILKSLALMLQHKSLLDENGIQTTSVSFFDVLIVELFSRRGAEKLALQCLHLWVESSKCNDASVRRNVLDHTIALLVAEFIKICGKRIFDNHQPFKVLALYEKEDQF